MNTSALNQALRFAPLFRPYIWGGRRLETILNKQIPNDGIWAESWEIVEHGHDQSLVAEGPFQGKSLRELIESWPVAILGPHASHNDHFPLLLKFLDCQRVLSVQVHPGDSYAQKMNPPDLGKTEAWYVIEADQESVIYAGLKEGVGLSELTESIANGTIEGCLHSFTPKVGDCIFIPAGTVHALGAGLIVAEIQQASDTTFRLYDWNRLSGDGSPRPLHIVQALEVIEFERGPVAPVIPTATKDAGRKNLVTCDRFVLDEVRSDLSHFTLNGRFAIGTVVRGHATIHISGSSQSDCELSLGQSILLPAAIEAVSISLPADSILLLARPPE